MQEEQLPPPQYDPKKKLSLDNLEPREYEPREVAALLGVSTNVLRTMRQNGRITGNETKNNTRYTPEQIRAAKLERSKPGPKTGEGSRIGRAKYSWPSDKGGDNSSSVASVRKRRAGRRNETHLTGLIAVGA